MFRELLNEQPHKQIERIRKKRRELTKQILSRFAEHGNTQDPQLSREVSDTLIKAEEIDPDYKKRRNPYSTLKWYLYCWKRCINTEKIEYSDKSKLLMRLESFISAVRSNKELSEGKGGAFGKPLSQEEQGIKDFSSALEYNSLYFAESVKNWLKSRFSKDSLAKKFSQKLANRVFSIENPLMSIFYKYADEDHSFRKVLNEAIEDILPDQVYYDWLNGGGQFNSWTPNPDDFYTEDFQVDDENSKKTLSNLSKVYQSCIVEGVKIGLSGAIANFLSILSPPEPQSA